MCILYILSDIYTAIFVIIEKYILRFPKTLDKFQKNDKIKLLKAMTKTSKLFFVPFRELPVGARQEGKKS